MTKRIGLVGLDSSHAEDFVRHFNAEARHPGIRVTALFDRDPDRLGALQRLSPGMEAPASIEALCGHVDLVIVGTRHGDLHKEHGLAAIDAGLPLFVDKPLACSLVDAEAIVAAAEARGTLLLSGSALRWQSETKWLKVRLAGFVGSVHVTAYGTWYPRNEYGGAIFYAIHSIELVQELIGPRWSTVTVEQGDNPVVHYRSGAHEVSIRFRPPGESGVSAFGVSISAHGVGLEQSVPLGDDYMLPVVDEIATMMRTGSSPQSREDLLAPVALMETIGRLLRVVA